MTAAIPVREFFQVGERFHRSVNVAADYLSRRTFDDYIITSLSKHVLSRVSHGLRENSRARAWSITGPYGAGKSAFALFMAQVLGYPTSDDARTLLASKDPELLDSLYDNLAGLREGGYLIVPMVGSREPISWTLLHGLVESLSAQVERTPTLEGHIATLQDLYECARRGELIPATRIAEAVQDGAQIVQSSEPRVLGTLIIYDELGRSLEYAALYPDHGDIGILQTLAELAARSEDSPISLITILHQAFEHYAANLSFPQQREWAKVQGRFEDIGFLVSPGELLGIVDKAITRVRSAGELDAMIASEIDRAEQLSLLPNDLDRQSARHILAGCAPLHPTVALTLGRLFRSRLSQNERSLFAFLTSGEPYGFQEYLKGETWGENNYRPFYRLDSLYDYVSMAMGSVLYTQGQGKKWAEIEDALDRLPKDSRELEARLVKAAGLLGLLGDQRDLKASEEILAYALANGQDVDGDDVHEGLERLERLGVMVHRRFKDAYSLWEGSDIDLDERFEQGMTQIDRSQSLASLLQARDEVKPYVAKRHLHETGTLRHFAPWIIHLEDLHEAADRSFGSADGVVVFVLGTGGTLVQEVISRVKDFSAELGWPRNDLLLFAVPEGIQGIREALEETMAWEWVRRNTPELEGDSIARRELAARRLAAQQRLGRASARCFEPALAYRSCRWVRAGKRLDFDSARGLRALISDACDQAYHSAPIVKNELINRSQLSSAAAAARRNLIERMITLFTEARLGIEGYPPEMSIYLSVLESPGIHHRDGGIWGFGPPEGEDPHRVTPLWKAIDSFLMTTEDKPRPVTDLYEILRQPPFGIKDGLLPIYLVAALLRWQSEVAVYEEGSFVPQVQAAECERLMRVPERFSVQRYHLDESRALMLQRYSDLFGDRTDPACVSVLTAVRPIMAFANQLPGYTQITQSLTKEAIAVREALFSAREPQRLLLETLPHALGFEVAKEDTAEVEKYFLSLKQVLVELQRAYEELLMTIESQLLDALLLPYDLEAARQEIAPRAQILEQWIADLRLKAFVLRLSDRTLPHREWLESVAAVLTNKPPNQWNDGDVLRYRVAVADIAGQFRRTEELGFSEGDMEEAGDAGRRIRLSVTDMLGREQREVVRIKRDQENQVREAVTALMDALQEVGADKTMRMMAVAELSRKILEDMSLLEEDDE